MTASLREAWVKPDCAIPDGMEKVMRCSPTALCLADEGLDDTPLVAINTGFVEATGYDADAVLGQNCRMLQPGGGAGPVTRRMRDFVADRTQTEARFVVPNVTASGKRFLNVVYMTRIVRKSFNSMILGSQFALMSGMEDAEVYERGLQEDLINLTRVLSETDWMMAGSMDAIANTHRILARYRFERE